MGGQPRHGGAQLWVLLGVLFSLVALSQRTAAKRPFANSILHARCVVCPRPFPCARACRLTAPALATGTGERRARARIAPERSAPLSHPPKHDDRTDRGALPESGERARRRLAEELEAGDFPSIRRSLQLLQSGDDLTQIAGKQAMELRWQELTDNLKETVYLHDDDYYKSMRKERLYNVEWCLRTLVSWNLCLYPDESPDLPGGRPSKPKPAKPKGVYTHSRNARVTASSGRRYGYARP